MSRAWPIGLAALVLVLSTSVVAMAGTVVGTYTEDFSGATGNRAASARFTYHPDTGKLTVELNNDTAAGNTQSAGDLLTGVMFQWSGPGTPVYESGNASRFIDVASDGSVTDAVPTPTEIGWSIDNTDKLSSIPSGHHLLSFSPDPDKAIIGQEEADGDYSTTANSIRGNGPHNPFAYLTGNFTLDLGLPSLPSSILSDSQEPSTSSLVSNVVFYFGTDLESNTTPDGFHSVPLPTGAWMGFACLGLLFVVRRVRKRRHQAA